MDEIIPVVQVRVVGKEEILQTREDIRVSETWHVYLAAMCRTLGIEEGQITLSVENGAVQKIHLSIEKEQGINM